MSSTQYILFPIETEPEDLLAAAIARIQLAFPGWQPRDGELDIVILEAVAAMAADVRDIASQVPNAIFRYFGSSLLGLSPVDAAPATVASTWTATDTAGHTVPAGTQVVIRDSTGIAWPFYVLTDVVIPFGSSVTAAGAVTLVAVTPGTDSSGLGTVGSAVQLLDVLSWVSAVVQTGSTSGGVDAELDSAYLNRLRRKLQLLSPRPILAPDFATLALDIPGVQRATAIDNYNPLHNLLTANEASMETDASGWIATVNCAIASSSAQSADGAKSVTLTSTAGGDMQAALAVASEKAVTPGDVITALASFRSAVSVRSCKVGIEWITAGGASISTTLSGGTNDSTSAWINLNVTGTAPATAAKARVFVVVTATGAGSEVHYIDKASMRRGTTTDWVAGDTAETGNQKMVSVAMVDSSGAAVSTPVKNAYDTYIQALREANFLVFEIDPVFTTVNIAFTATTYPGYDAADAIDRAEVAIQAYLSPAAWGIGPNDTDQTWTNLTIVRYLEIATVINNTEGINAITVLTINGSAADLTLGGVIPLPTVGTVVGTAA